MQKGQLDLQNMWLGQLVSVKGVDWPIQSTKHAEGSIRSVNAVDWPIRSPKHADGPIRSVKGVVWLYQEVTVVWTRNVHVKLLLVDTNYASAHIDLCCPPLTKHCQHSRVHEQEPQVCTCHSLLGEMHMSCALPRWCARAQVFIMGTPCRARKKRLLLLLLLLL